MSPSGVMDHEPLTLAATPSMPTPLRQRGLWAVEQNRECERCHVEHAAEWRESLHGRSQIEPAYTRAFSREPLAFCQGCHAPESVIEQPLPREVAEIGVSCVTCHLVDGGILAAAVERAAGERAPHPVLRDARFSSAAACAGCHEFEFPAAGAGSARLMQSTVSEHRASPFARTPCAECHMPEDGFRRSHRFSSSRDPEFLRRSLRVTARRTPAGSVELTLAPLSVGHAFPTGDLFRRLELTVESFGAEQQVVSARTKYLARHFRSRPSAGAFGRMELVADDRPGRHGAAESRFDFELGAGSAKLPVAWSVAYQRVEHPRSIDESDALLEGEIVLAEGLLRPTVAGERSTR
jgi:hypothetical protein